MVTWNTRSRVPSGRSGAAKVASKASERPSADTIMRSVARSSSSSGRYVSSVVSVSLSTSLTVRTAVEALGDGARTLRITGEKHERCVVLRLAAQHDR